MDPMNLPDVQPEPAIRYDSSLRAVQNNCNHYWRTERGFNTKEEQRVRVGAYLWSWVPFNNTLKHECVSFFDGVDPLTDVIIIDVTRCA